MSVWLSRHFGCIERKVLTIMGRWWFKIVACSCIVLSKTLCLRSPDLQPLTTIEPWHSLWWITTLTTCRSLVCSSFSESQSLLEKITDIGEIIYYSVHQAVLLLGRTETPLSSFNPPTDRILEWRSCRKYFAGQENKPSPWPEECLWLTMVFSRSP